MEDFGRESVISYRKMCIFIEDRYYMDWEVSWLAMKMCFYAKMIFILLRLY